MQALIEGIGWGFFLTFLIGPIVFALLQAGIEYGFRAGAMMGLGIWLSDVFYICIMYFGFSYVRQITELAGFEFWMGLIGGIILMSFGIGNIWGPPPQLKYASDLAIPRSNPYLALFTKGMLVNAINPFTIFFWLGMMSAISTRPKWGVTDIFIFFASIIGTIIITDLTKVYLAKQIRKKLKIDYLIWVRRITGLLLIVFGVTLIFRVAMG